MSDRPIAFCTQFGMVWYPEGAESIIVVERLATLNGRAVLRIVARTKDQDIDDAAILEVTVSKKARVIRTYPVQGNVGEWDG